MGCFHNDVPWGYGYYKSQGWDPAPWDFAVLEFDEHPRKGNVQPLSVSPHTCGPRGGHPVSQTPGNSLGYWAWGQWTESAINNSTPSLYGFPGDKDPEPQLWGHGLTSSPLVSPVNQRLIWHALDTIGGQSGSALAHLTTSIMGTHVGYDATWNTNVARRIDADYVNFVYANSAYGL